MNLKININGSISKDQLDKAMFLLGELILNRVKQNVRDMELQDTGSYLQGWFSKWNGSSLVIDNLNKYAIYLEYGTYSYWQMNGLDNFTDPMDPKKKNLPANLRKLYPKGMQSFAPLRKVIYNDGILNSLVKEAFSYAMK